MEKIARLPPTYRALHDRGELLGHLTAEIKKTYVYINSCTILFKAPATLIAVQVFLILEVGYLGFVLLGVLIIAGIIQFLLDRGMYIAKSKKLDILGDRIQNNVEFIDSIREIKMLGW